METSSDTVVQDGRRYLGEQDKSSQPPGIPRSPQVFPSPFPLLLRGKRHECAICSHWCPPPSWEELGDIGSFRIKSFRIRKVLTKNPKPNAPEEQRYHCFTGSLGLQALLKTQSFYAHSFSIMSFSLKSTCMYLRQPHLSCYLSMVRQGNAFPSLLLFVSTSPLPPCCLSGIISLLFGAHACDLKEPPLTSLMGSGQPRVKWNPLSHDWKLHLLL